MTEKSKFTVSEKEEETKTKVITVDPSNKKPESKKHHDIIPLQVSKPSEIRKWQEVRLTSKLPDRRSLACSCIYKGR